MDQTKGLASEIGRQAEAEMKDFRDHSVERMGRSGFTKRPD
jgi:hypothetical protein